MDIWPTIYFLQNNYPSLIATGVFFYLLWRTGQFLWEQQQVAAEQRELRRQGQKFAVNPAVREERERQEKARIAAQRRIETQMRMARLRQEQEKDEHNRRAQTQAEQDETARALADWAVAEQQAALLSTISSEAEIQAQLRAEILALDDSLNDWEGNQQVGASGYRYQGPALATAIGQIASMSQITQTRLRLTEMTEKTQREFEDLEYVLNKVQTGVDFLPVQVRQTIERWKFAEIGRRITFDELKLKFRYQAYSIDDGLELYYLYDAWIEQQYAALFQAITDLGTPPRQEEDLLAAVERAERSEWMKDLNMSMDVIAALKDIRSIQEMLNTMKHRLRDLATVCKKRSKQIIEPDWEPKGLL